MTDSNYQKNSDVLRDYSEDKQYIDDYFRASRAYVCVQMRKPVKTSV